MTISDHMRQFGGLPIVDWRPGDAIRNPAETLFRLAIDYDSEIAWSALFSNFLAAPLAGFAAGIVAGAWQGEESDAPAEDVVQAVMRARDQLPNAAAFFIGDITFEENEISWIVQTDVAPLVSDYPRLEHFGARGGEGFAFTSIRHEALRTLVLESGGLPAEVVKGVLGSTLPSLEHLELWLGDSGYGATTTVDDLAPLFSGELFPRLRSLALRDSELTDDIAEALVASPLVTRLESLDLSLGTLGDRGAVALADSPAVRRLRKLDLHHHYVTPDVMQRLARIGPEVDVSDRREPSVYGGEESRYVAVAE